MEAGVELLKLGKGFFDRKAGTFRGAVERSVVEYKRNVIFAQPQIEFDSVRVFETGMKRRQRVFGPDFCGAAVTDDQRINHEHDSTQDEAGGQTEMNSVSILLVEPENPDNIGAASRAIKNMGFSNLRLVKPPKGWMRKAKKMSMSAYDVTQQAEVFETVKDAVADLHAVIGTTRRFGPKRGAFLPWNSMLGKIPELAVKGPLGVMFGKESKGLDNASLRLCDWVTTIPANPEYPSLNLSQAVLVVCYELSRIFSGEKTQYETGMNFVSKEEELEVLGRLQQALQALGYERPGSKARIVERITQTFHRMWKRGGLLSSEAQMFRGLARRIVKKS